MAFIPSPHNGANIYASHTVTVKTVENKVRHTDTFSRVPAVRATLIGTESVLFMFAFTYRDA